jgi:integrase
MARWTFHGDGVQSKEHRGADGVIRRRFYPRYSYKGRRYLDKSKRTERAARARVSELLEEKDRMGDAWVPPHIKREQEKAERERADARRAELLFETAVDGFVKARADRYARPREVPQILARCGRTFGGRYLDKIARGEIKRYPAQRGKIRTAQQELSVLSQVYRWLQDNGHDDLNNPCLANGRGLLSEDTYTPKHKKVIPGPDVLRALFTEADAKPKRRTGITRRMGAFLRLLYYTGCRPEEIGALRCSDVRLPDPKVVGTDRNPIPGCVTIRKGKTANAARGIPLHPEAVDAVKAIMRDPDDWLFVRKVEDDERPWDRYTYRKAWVNILDAVAKDHPEVADMWVRDLRSTFETRLIDAGVHDLVVKRLMGHAKDGRDMTARYYELTEDPARKAILNLSLGSPAPRTAGRQVVPRREDRVVACDLGSTPGSTVIPVKAVKATS